MSDTARTAVVSSEPLNELCAEKVLRGGANDGSDVSLTECSVINHINCCSDRNDSDGKAGSYQEIDSFSELSFTTNDAISLQDLMESEFTARISTMNGDETEAKANVKSHDPFDDLFNDALNGEIQNGGGFSRVDEKFQGPIGEMVNNLDDFINGSIQGKAGLIMDYLAEDLDVEENRKCRIQSVNIFKMDTSKDIPIFTNFDPFTAIEEDSDSSNPFPINSDVFNSPDEFSFPESPESTKPDETTEIYIAEVDNSNPIREFFSKSVSDDNFEYPSEGNQDTSEDEFQFQEAKGPFNVDPVDTAIGKLQLDEFYSAEDIPSTRKTHQIEETNNSRVSAVPPFPSPKEPSNRNDTEENFLPETTFHEANDCWTTVEEVLNAQTNCVKPNGDAACLVDLTNKCDKPNHCLENCANDVSDQMGPHNPEADYKEDSDSETETKSESSEKKTIKKKKSKKGKKSEEKENISIEEGEEKAVGKSALDSSLSVLEDIDDLANVCVKNLMLAYSAGGPKSLETRYSAENGSVHNLKARSMVDLTSNSNKVATLRSNLFESSKSLEASRSTTDLSSGQRHPVVTGVSVQALKKRYCSMIYLNLMKFYWDEMATETHRRKICVPWSEALKSSFTKFDQLSKKTILHVRSVDTSKVQKQFNEAATGATEVISSCKTCGKQVFQMEQVKAEKSVWHKNCFRCKECNKQLSVDTYSSNEGILYCKPHFKDLFKPKAVLDDDDDGVKLKKPELIIRENQPVELPPEVVRASDKPDLGLDELASLNVKSRYQVFEKGSEVSNEPLEKGPTNLNVKRSPSILSKLAKFQKKGIDVGVRDEELNGLPMDQSSTSSEDDDEEGDDDDGSSQKIVKAKKGKERPMSFSKMGDVKSVWESGIAKTREEMREERKAEIHQIRSKLFMGKQVKMKEAYEQAVRESGSISPRKSIDIRFEKAKSIKECFEKGEPLNVDDENQVDDTKKKTVDDEMGLFEAGISKKSRSLFLELDKSAQTQAASLMKKPAPSKSPTLSSLRNREVPMESVVKSSDAIEDVQVETAEISSKFKFFESYKEPEKEKKKFRMTPPREGQTKGESPEKEIVRDPNVVRACDKVDHEIIRTNTTTKMLSLFRQMEEKTEQIPEGPKPLKRFTPPPDYKENSEGDSDEDDDSEVDEEEDEEEEEEGGGGSPLMATNPNLIRASDRVEDEYLKQATNAARAKQLRAKFEKWEEKEKEKEREKEREEALQRKMNGLASSEQSTENTENVQVTSIECTKSLRARFESMKGGGEGTKEKMTRPKVNRFVEIQNNMADLCDVCRGRVYQLEKVETCGKIFHKACFRCMQCNCLLRMESFTLNCGNLYCLPHFKQKFISKGNYDEGFGVDQHKAKWPTVTSF